MSYIGFIGFIGGLPGLYQVRQTNLLVLSLGKIYPLVIFISFLIIIPWGTRPIEKSFAEIITIINLAALHVVNSVFIEASPSGVHYSKLRSEATEEIIFRVIIRVNENNTIRLRDTEDLLDFTTKLHG